MENNFSLPKKIKYLKRLKKLSSQTPNKTIGAAVTGRTLKMEEIDSIEIEVILKNEGLITEFANIPGTLLVTEKGIKEIKNNTWYFKIFYFKFIYSKFIEEIRKKYTSSIFYGLLIFIIFEVIEPFFNIQVNKYWVGKILSLFHSSTSFDIAFVIFSLIIILLNFKRNPRAWDFFFTALYIKYRFFDSFWNFMPLFSHVSNQKYFSYIDSVGLYYLFILSYVITKKLKSKRAINEYADGMFYPDLSLNKQSGKTKESIIELDKKGLNRNKFASEIAEVIQQMKPFEAFAIGICGPWGSGKTSLIELILENLKKSKKGKNYMYIEFSPWFFNNSEMLITNFFSSLESKFRFNKSLASELKAYGKEIAMAEKSILKTEFSKLMLGQSKSLKERYNSIIKEIQTENKILIITIDDLDRLDKKEIVDVFRLIRLVADFPNTFYIVGYDRGYINSAIKQELTKYEPQKYIDKVFNMEFKIPELSPDIIKERLKLLLELQISKLGKNVININTGELAACFKYQELHRFIKNERDIKRFSNTLMMRYLSIKEEINFFHFFLLELIYYKEQSVFNSIYENRDSIFKSYREMMSKQSDSSPINFEDALQITIQSAINKILLVLFEKNGHYQPYSISNELYFNRYFSLSLLANDFSTAEFESSLNEPFDKLKLKLVEFNTSNSPLLAEKFYHKFRNVSITDKNELIKMTDSLLFLYNEVYHSRNQEALINGLNANDLGKFIFDTVTLSPEDISFLEQRVLAFNIQDYSAFSFLMSIDSIVFETTGEPTKRRIWHTSFKIVQLELLKREITNNGGTFNENIIKQLQLLRRFITVDKDDVYTQNEIIWFKDNVITRNKEFIFRNLDFTIAYIKEKSLVNSIFDTERMIEIIDSIFHDINLDVYREKEFEKLKDFYNGFDLLKVLPYTFSNQIPKSPSHLECNDHIYPDIFDLKPGIRFEITIEPNNTLYWRFGFRLSRTQEFPEIITSRHIDEYPFIHLFKGHIDGKGDGQDDSPPNLDLAVYSGSKLEYVERLIENYDNLGIAFSFEMRERGVFFLTITEGSTYFIKTAKPIKQFSDFQFVQISAWSDQRQFGINSRIKILQKIK